MLLVSGKVSDLQGSGMKSSCLESPGKNTPPDLDRGALGRLGFGPGVWEIPERGAIRYTEEKKKHLR